MKHLSKILAALLALVMILSLVGCAGKGGDAAKANESADTGPVGTWRVSKINGEDLETAFRKQAEANDMTLEQMIETFNLLAAMGGADFKLSMDNLNDYALLELKADGTVTFTSLGSTVEGTWKQNGNTVNVTLVSEGETSEQTLTMENGTLRMTNPDSGEVMTFEKK